MNMPIDCLAPLAPALRNSAASLLVGAWLSAFASPSVVLAQAPPAAPLSWTFAGPQGDGVGWTAERGSIAAVDGKMRMQPDASRRVVLLSPPGLPDAARDAGQFVLAVAGTGLERVRIQGRRDARGGWITLADARGKALRQVADGVAIERTAGKRGAPIERLRIELEFRTTNPRTLERIVVVPAPT